MMHYSEDSIKDNDINISDLVLEHESKDDVLNQQIKEAVANCQQAENEDKAGNYRDALELYKDCIFKLLTLGKITSLSECLRKKIRAKCSALLTRASSLKKWTENLEHMHSMVSSTPPPAHATGNIRQNSDVSRYIFDPGTSFDDVVGLEYAKDVVKEFILLPFMFPHLFFQGASSPIRNYRNTLLIFGASGVGKTFLSKAICNTKSWSASRPMTDITCYRLNMYECVNSYDTDRTRIIRNVFSAAMNNEPSIIVLEEMEALINTQHTSNDFIRRMKSEILLNLDGVNNNAACSTIVVCISQEPWRLNMYLRRRIYKYLYLKMPDHDRRVQIFRSTLKTVSNDVTDNDLEELGIRTIGYSPSDIVALCKDVMLQPVREIWNATHFKKVFTDKDKEEEYKYKPCQSDNIDAEIINVLDMTDDQFLVLPVTMKHCLACLSKCKPTIDSEEIQKYDKYALDKTGWIPNDLMDKNKESLEVMCCKTLACILRTIQPSMDIETMLSIELPLPKSMKLRVLKYYVIS